MPVIAFALTLSMCSTGSSDVVWINEFHYDNSGVDANEFVEVVVLNNTFAPPDLGSIRVDLYDENGTPYDQIFLNDPLVELTSTTEADFLVWRPAAINDGTGGISLSLGVMPLSFVSYGGVVVANGGAADGLTSTDIGFIEDNTTSASTAIGLTGIGQTSDDFTWLAPLDGTAGGLNIGQSFGTAVPEPSGGVIVISLGIAWGVCRRRR